MRGEALHQGLAVVAGLPAAAVQLDRRVEVLGDGLGGDAADLDERVAPDDRGGPAPEDAVVAVLAGQDDLEEHALVVTPGLEVLERVVIAEVVGGLDHRHLGVVEIAHRGVEDVGLGHVVGIEHEEQLGVDHAEGMIDVAGLGVTVVGSGDVAGPVCSASARTKSRRPSSSTHVTCG